MLTRALLQGWYSDVFVQTRRIAWARDGSTAADDKAEAEAEPDADEEGAPVEHNKHFITLLLRLVTFLRTLGTPPHGNCAAKARTNTNPF